MQKGNKRNLIAGQVFEEYVVKKFNNAGVFPTLGRTAELNTDLDRRLYDLCTVNEEEAFPFQIQVKNSVKTVQYGKILERMGMMTINAYHVPIIIHKKTVNEGGRYLSQGTYTVLHFVDFLTIIKKLEQYKKAYNELTQFWDTIPEEFKQETHQRLRELDL